MLWPLWPLPPTSAKRQCSRAFLKLFTLVTTLSAKQIKAFLGRLEERSFGDGEYIFQEGDEGDSFYILREGRVQIVRREMALQRQAGRLEVDRLQLQMRSARLQVEQADRNVEFARDTLDTSRRLADKGLTYPLLQGPTAVRHSPGGAVASHGVPGNARSRHRRGCPGPVRGGSKRGDPAG